MIIKLILISLIVFLWCKGGQKNGRIRDIPIPIILAAYLAIYLKTWWLFLACGVGLQSIRLGYGNYDPENDPKSSFLAKFTHDRQGAIIRLIWGSFVGLFTPIALVIGHYLTLPKYALYVAINALFGYLVSKLRFNVLFTDIFVAVGVGSILFLI